MTLKWILVVISAITFIACDSFSALWGKTGNKAALLLFFILSPIGYLFFGLLNRNTALSISSGLVNIALLTVTIGIGIFYFQDEITVRQGVGLFFAVIAVILML